MPTFAIRYAPHAFRLMNGVFCVYKPSDIGMKKLQPLIREKLVNELNEMDVRPPKERVVIEGSFKDEKFSAKLVPSYSDLPAVVGPRYLPKDLTIFFSNYCSWRFSGVLVGGIGTYGCYLASELWNSNFLRVYELKCKLGIATDTCWSDGKVVEKSTLKHISKERMDVILNKIQSAQQSQMFKTLGMNLTSQEAYEIASRGMIRPSSRKTNPILYGLRCIHFDAPNFTLEIQTINENEEYLVTLVNDIGLKMKSNACVINVRCTRYGNFTIDNALLEKHWTVENIINNIQMCKPLVSEDKLLPSINIKSAEYHQQSFLEMLQKRKKIGIVSEKTDEI
ncbi:putative tRNA pseudouridine synthase 2-like protein [Dinothrombium tinctorium]|uniref:Putative tRNA pseudouridine synthase 2-like protein n=1 Tax=Dinothrombium tinctorium TaxID=1965070 RepID=A0A3S3QB49_9ACAR|nr:putative tRNA pseudouridine synthase 2-like protein [Dinothrombium tinctorium]